MPFSFYILARHPNIYRTVLLNLKKIKFAVIFGIVILNFPACKKPEQASAKSATVYIEKTENGYQLIRNHTPFYIKGAAASPLYLEELKKAGANTARIYDTLNLIKTLDDAETLGLAVVVDIPLPRFNKFPEFYEEPELFNKIKRNVEKFVEKHKDHPSLLYWNLGNEIYYPYLHKRTLFFSNYNSLIDLIHEIDPNHPISTTTIGANKLRVLSILNKSPQLDFISFNAFGSLNIFSKKLKPIAPIWEGPHVITEWGTNGPWEVGETSWTAPLERNSTEKAEDIHFRYHHFIEPLKGKNSLGSFVFYWGKKDESTPTWFSLFGKDSLKTKSVFEMNKIWTKNDLIYPGPEVDRLLINGKRGFNDIILPPETLVEAEILAPKARVGNLKYTWEIRLESWHDMHKSVVIEGTDFQKENNKVTFPTPEKDGPYRLFVYLTNETEYFATANIPFYVLNPENGE